MKKRFTCFALMFVFITGLSSALFAEDKFPNLIGKWIGSRTGHSLTSGFVSANSGILFDIKEQQGRAFSGTKAIFHLDRGKKRVNTTEAFSGVIASDGKTFYIADKDDGTTIGNILSSDNIEMYYVQSGGKEGQMALYLNLKRLKQ